MTELNVEEAKVVINTNTGHTAVFWYSTDCPVCKQFLEVVMPQVQETMVNWSFYKINFDDHVSTNGVFFEPARMPMGYFFKDNSRLFVGDGFAPTKEVISLMTNLESPNYKAEQEIEQEQLAELEAKD
jgi:thioredoxin-like negative regulator of GroEL